MNMINQLEQHFECRRVKGWIRIGATKVLDFTRYKTARIAKLMPNGELQFTMGGTDLGEEIGLNETIRRIIVAEGIELLERESTSGSRKRGGEYPAFDCNVVAPAVVLKIIYRVEGAAIYGATNSA